MQRPSNKVRWRHLRYFLLALAISGPVAAGDVNSKIAEALRTGLAGEYNEDASEVIRLSIGTETARLEVVLWAGQINAIVAACADKCEELALKLFDRSGLLLLSNANSQDVTVIKGVPTYTGLHMLEIGAVRCEVPVCMVDVAVLRQGGASGLPSIDDSQAALQPTNAEEGTLHADAAFKECGVCPEMIVAPVGQFLLGSPISEEGRHSDEGPQVTAYVTRKFAVARFEVTRDEYDAFVNETGYEQRRGCHIWNAKSKDWHWRLAMSYRYPGFKQEGNHPVVCVDWDDVQAYVAWLQQKTANEYRLLSEAEWEFVARAGATTPFWWGPTIRSEQANYADRSPRHGTVPVDSFDPNPWGLYNVHGNVWEWVQDCYFDDAYQLIARAVRNNEDVPQRECAPEARAFRGGSWVDGPDSLRSASRVWQRSGGRYNHLGFRVARTLQ